MNENLKEQLNKKISTLIADLTRSKNWYEVIHLDFPINKSNPFARIKYGSILSNGLHEAAIGYYIIFWDGTIIKKVGV